MLEPQDRRLLNDLLKPSPGYVFDSAIVTTFSLDLQTLLSIPLAFTAFQIEEDDGRHNPSSAALLEAARRYAEQISVFCQGGQIIPPGRRQPLLAFLETSVTQISLRPTGLFHPKVWVLRYVAGKQVKYRAAALSRNLTNSNAWDVCAVVEGDLDAERQLGRSRSNPLGDFIAALAAFQCKPSLSARTAERVRLFAEEVRRVDFTVPAGFGDFAFHPIGIPGYPRFPLRDLGKRALVIAPFVSPKTLGRLAAASDEVVLVSRGTELDRIPAHKLEDFAEVLVMRDEAVAGAAADESKSVAGRFDETLHGLHAKVYLAEDGAQSTMWVGSANATNAAFEHNIEFLMSFTAHRRLTGVDAVMNGGNEDEVGLRKLLGTYQPPEQFQPDLLQEQLEERVDALRRTLAALPLVAEVSTTDNGFGLKLRIAGSIEVPLEETAVVHVWPISIPESSARVVDLRATPDTPLADFGIVTRLALTSFFAFRIQIEAEGRSASCAFVVNVPLEGAPEGRRADIIRELLSDESAMTRFLLLMLSGDPSGIECGESIDAREGKDSSAGTGTADQLLELLLQHLYRSPERVDDLAETISAFLDEPEYEARLPPGFRDVWAPVLSARVRLRERGRS